MPGNTLTGSCGEAPPGAGLTTVKLASPITCAPGTVAVSVVGMTCVAATVVVRPPLVQLSDAPAMKLFPVTAIGRSHPAAAQTGEAELTDGTRWASAKGTAVELPPPGPGLVAITFTVCTACIKLAG